MKLSWQTVVAYVKNLFPNNAPVRATDNPQADAKMIAHIAGGDVFYVTQRNGEKYWRLFVGNIMDVELVRYVLRSNGLNPKQSNAGMMFVVRCADVKNNPNAIKFMDMVINHNVAAHERDMVAGRAQYIRNLMAKQKTK